MSGNNPYIDQQTGTFRNKLGITDPGKLHATEYRVSAERIAELEASPIRGDFGLEHMKQVHGRIFGDLYGWAGKTRTVNISKTEPGQSWRSRFADVDRLEDAGRIIAGDVKAMNRLKGLDKADVVKGMTAVFAKMNYMHPFPEGNGRTTQTMMKLLAREAGYELDFSKVSRREWNEAAARTMPQSNIKEPGFTRRPDFQPMLNVFDKITSRHEREKTAAKERPGRER